MPPTDPDPRFTARGGNFTTYYRPWDYLLVGSLFLGMALALAVFTVYAMATNSNFRHPIVLVLWGLVLVIGGIATWAVRRFIRWRQARIEWARVTRTPYRGIFELSSQIKARRAK